MILTLVKSTSMCLVLTICMSVSLSCRRYKRSSAYEGLLTKKSKQTNKQTTTTKNPEVTCKREIETKALKRRIFKLLKQSQTS